jgi:hypothetical protein
VIRLLALAASVAAVWLAAAPPVGAGEAKAEPTVLIVFPFDSPGDDGKEGNQFAENLRLRGQRLGFVTVDRLSVKDAMSGQAMPGLATTAAEMAVILKDRFGATLGVWGVMRPDGEGFVVEVRGLNLRQGDGSLTVSKTYRATQRQLVNAVQDEILADLSGKTKRPVAEAAPKQDAKIPTVGPELVKNGGFETGAKTPDGWDRVDGLTTFWVAGESPTGKCIKVVTDVYHDQWVEWRKKHKDGAPAEEAPEKIATSGAKYDTVAGIYGAAYFSDPIPVAPGKSYKVTVSYRGESTDFFFPKLFIRGYADVKGDKRAVYDAYLALRCRKQGKEWESNVRIVDIPPDTQAPVEFVRLMLYAYWPPGTFYFDNVSMKEVAPRGAAGEGAPKAGGPKPQ